MGNLLNGSPEPRNQRVRNGTSLGDVGSLTMEASKASPNRQYVDEYEDLLDTIE